MGTADVGGTTWQVWNGMNGDMNVYSFVAPSPVTSFNTDIKDFFTHLTDSYSFPASSQYLISMFSHTLQLFALVIFANRAQTYNLVLNPLPVLRAP